MKKILSIALILGATALMACPMGQGMMNGQGMMGGNCQGPMMAKCGCDTKKLPPMMENLGLSDKQKEQVAAIRAEGKAFHNQQHDKMMGVLTPEQRGKLEGMKMMMGQGNGPKNCPMNSDMKPAQMPANGM